MSIFKRGRTYWFHFWWNGEHVQQSTQQGNPRIARQIEAAFRTRLAKGEVGIVEKKPAPKFSDFAERLMEAIKVRCAEKPLTIRFYNSKLARLLEFGPLASCPLDGIDEAMVEAYVQDRRTPRAANNADGPPKVLSPASVNRELATLRRLLGLAYEWHLIDRIPVIKKLPGERSREFVVSRQQEVKYLAMAPQPLRDAALLMLDEGMRVGEVVGLEKRDVHLEPSNGAKFGYIRIREGKSRNARRVVSLTERVRSMLASRMACNESIWVFPGDGGSALLATSLDYQHSKVRGNLGLPKDFVLHSFRHSMLTRLGEAGIDAFSIMRIAGHSSVTVSERYVHPSAESLERAFERLEAFNKAAVASEKDGNQQPVATVSATVQDSTPASYQQIASIQ